MEEITCNIHIHSTFSDGTGTYSTISSAAAAANLDVIIITDHNVWVNGNEGYYENAGRRVLVLTGEEVHNQDRDPQKNHMLVLGAESEMAVYASDPQNLIDRVHEHHGLSFLAHPDEMDLKLVHETDISWVDWSVEGFDGLEIWNHMSEFKTRSRSLVKLLENVFSPKYYAVGPLKATLERWDAMLAAGRHVFALGGSDSHMLKYKIGPFIKWIYPYEFHFSCINNHLILPEPLSGDLGHDKSMIYTALRNGSSFVGYDLPSPTRGFTFTASTEKETIGMGETLNIQGGGTLQARLPQPAELRLIKDGKVIYHSSGMERLSYPVHEAGAYRIECYREYHGQMRGWIFSNPIFLTRGEEKCR